jgi:hypothetical protein
MERLNAFKTKAGEFANSQKGRVDSAKSKGIVSFEFADLKFRFRERRLRMSRLEVGISQRLLSKM